MRIVTAIVLRLGLGLLLCVIAIHLVSSAQAQQVLWRGTNEQNKALVRRWIEEGFNKRDPSVVDAIFGETMAINARVMRREDLKESMRRRLAAFPDLHVTIDECIGEGDQVGIWYTVHATHQGEFDGVGPTGRQVTWAGCDYFRIDRGKIAEGRFLDDSLGLLRQLGAQVVPPAHGPN